MNAKKMDEKVADLQREKMKLETQVASGTPPEKPGRIRLIKRTLARIYTIKREGVKQ